MKGTLEIQSDRVTTVSDWRHFGISWKSAVRRHLRTNGGEVFVLLASGRGTLYKVESGRIGQTTWRMVRLVP